MKNSKLLLKLHAKMGLCKNKQADQHLTHTHLTSSPPLQRLHSDVMLLRYKLVARTNSCKKNIYINKDIDQKLFTHCKCFILEHVPSFVQFPQG